MWFCAWKAHSDNVCAAWLQFIRNLVGREISFISLHVDLMYGMHSW